MATPVNWKHGEDVVVVPTLSDEQAKEKVHFSSSVVNDPLNPFAVDHCFVLGLTMQLLLYPRICKRKKIADHVHSCFENACEYNLLVAMDLLTFVLFSLPRVSHRTSYLLAKTT